MLDHLDHRIKRTDESIINKNQRFINLMYPDHPKKECTLSLQGRHVAHYACLHGDGSVLPKLYLGR